MLRDELKQKIESVLGQEVKLEHPALRQAQGKVDHGDFSIFKTPLELAEELASELSESSELSELVEKIEVAKPGFINFWLSKAALSRELELALKEGERYTKSSFAYGTRRQKTEDRRQKAEKIMVEFTDPNPFKQFHIGHLYSNTVGEALCRLFEAQGALVWRVNYQGDVGLHVAKSVYGLLQRIKNSKLKMQNLEKKSLGDRVKVLGEAYALGNRAYEEDPEARREIEELNRKIYALPAGRQGKDPEIKELYEKGRGWSLEYFDTVYARLGTKFKRYYFESEAGKAGLELVRKYLKDGIFVESEGAVIFPGEKYGLHNRVFVNSQGLPTYEAKELGLAPTKYKDFPYDESYIVTGNEIVAYFKVLLRALQEVNPELGKKTHHIPHGMVRLPVGKMGSRTGDVITAEWLLDEVKKRLKASYPQMPEETAEKVAVGAVKYALLRSSIGKDVVFDFEKSLSFEGDSGPYLQYTFARTQSVLRKAKGIKEIKDIGDKRSLALRARILGDSDIREPNSLNSLAPEELAILRTFYRYPEVVQEAAEGFAPNLVCGFLFELAQKYNAFYNAHRIINPKAKSRKQKAEMEFRLALNTVVGNILKSGLGLLGIESPEKM